MLLYPLLVFPALRINERSKARRCSIALILEDERVVLFHEPVMGIIWATIVNVMIDTCSRNLQQG